MHFERRMKKIDISLSPIVDERARIFRDNCFDAILKTHKLHGKRKGHWAFSITAKFRVMFAFIDSDTVLFEDVGDHSIYE